MRHFDADYAREVIARLKAIPEDTVPRWGELRRNTLIEHLIWVIMHSMGRSRQVPFNGNWFTTHLLGPAFLTGWFPIPRNIKLPKDIAEQGATMRESGNLDTLAALLEEYLALVQADELEPAPHPVFGDIGVDGWDRMHVMHFEHHLRQFAHPAGPPKKKDNRRLYVLLTIAAISSCYLARQEYRAHPPELRGLENAPAYMLEAPIPAQGPFPTPEQAVYTTADRKEHPYLFVAAENPPDPRTAVIYMHGSGGDENEGMDTEIYRGLSGRIRAACRDRCWHYVSPRDYEFDTLLADIEKRFASERVFIIGHSLGGKETFFYQQTHPDAFDGAIYGCPAVSPLDLFPRKLKTPEGKIVLLAGEREPDIAPFCRRFAGCLERRGVPCLFVEYPNGNHCDPLRLANWDALFNFVTDSPPSP